MTKQIDMPPPDLYRADLLKQAIRKRAEATPGLNANGTRDFRGLADETGLSVNTIRQAIDGNAPKIETLKILADRLGIAWVELFDVDRELQNLRNFHANATAAERAKIAKRKPESKLK